MSMRQYGRIGRQPDDQRLSKAYRRSGTLVTQAHQAAPVYGWFTEGFDTRDLKEAKALLTAIGSGVMTNPLLNISITTLVREMNGKPMRAEMIESR